MTTFTQLTNISGLTGMQQMASKSVDMVLSDPPYGIADKAKVTKVGNKFVSTDDAWGIDFVDTWDTIDAYWQWFKPFITEMSRVMKDDSHMILFLDRKYTGYIAYEIEKAFPELKFKNKIYFEKVNPIPHMRKNNYRSTIEEAIWFSKGKATFNFGAQNEMLQVYKGAIGRKTTINSIKHPTEKYKWMIEPLIKNHSNAGQVILDPFAGSSSTLAYAQEMGRSAVGFELNPTFYEMGMERLGLNKQLETSTMEVKTPSNDMDFIKVA